MRHADMDRRSNQNCAQAGPAMLKNQRAGPGRIDLGYIQSSEFQKT